MPKSVLLAGNLVFLGLKVEMYKNSDNTTARVLDGNKALSVKNELGLELRQ